VSTSLDHDSNQYAVIAHHRQIRIHCHWIGCDWYVDFGSPTSLGDLNDVASDHYSETRHG
jgi:hypothetical protein